MELGWNTNIEVLFQVASIILGSSKNWVSRMRILYDLDIHESSIAQWLEHLTGILEGHGFDSHRETQKFI